MQIKKILISPILIINDLIVSSLGLGVPMQEIRTQFIINLVLIIYIKTILISPILRTNDLIVGRLGIGVLTMLKTINILTIMISETIDQIQELKPSDSLQRHFTFNLLQALNLIQAFNQALNFIQAIHLFQAFKLIQAFVLMQANLFSKIQRLINSSIIHLRIITR